MVNVSYWAMWWTSKHKTLTHYIAGLLLSQHQPQSGQRHVFVNYVCYIHTLLGMRGLTTWQLLMYMLLYTGGPTSRHLYTGVWSPLMLMVVITITYDCLGSKAASLNYDSTTKHRRFLLLLTGPDGSFVSTEAFTWGYQAPIPVGPYLSSWLCI